MVKLNKIYTRTGDDGTTGLVDGSRVDKFHCRVKAYGDVDEANAAIGLIRTEIKDARLDQQLQHIQNDLFDMGADFATPYGYKCESILRIQHCQVEKIEQMIDELNAELEPLNSFVLPGGSKAAAQAHMARTIVRKAERHAYEVGKSEQVNAEAMKYLNRLSDYLFVLARSLNNKGKDDVLWQPGANQ